MVKGHGYYSCLLRLWQVGAGREVAWRALVVEIPGGQRRGFADLEGLFAYLREQAAAHTAQKEGDPDHNDSLGGDIGRTSIERST